MKPLHIETPFFESRALTIGAGRTVWLKLEAMQPPGSFKIRGIGLACQEYVRRGAERFISSSGGNAGIAVAYAGRHLSVPVIVVVPETTTDRAKALIQQEGAEVVVHGSSWHEANALALSMVKESDAFLHPFDDPLIWQGHASLVDEVVRSGVKPDVVVLSVGGGGLLSGVVEGLQRNGWIDVPVIAVETEGADSLAQSVRAGYPVELGRHHQYCHFTGRHTNLRTSVQLVREASSSQYRGLGSGRCVRMPKIPCRSPGSSGSRLAEHLSRSCMTAHRNLKNSNPFWSSFAVELPQPSNSCENGRMYMHNPSLSVGVSIAPRFASSPTRRSPSSTCSAVIASQLS